MARHAYFGSIGGWKKAIHDDSVIHAYYRFRDQRIVEMADEFLHPSNYGIKFPKCKDDSSAELHRLCQ